MSSKQKWFWTLVGIALIIAIGASSISYTSHQLTGFLESAGDESAFEGNGNLAILEVDGVLLDSTDLLEEIRELDEDRKEVKAVIVRLSSPGGAVGPTQEVYEALLELRKTKKVYCSMSDVAASGAYYISAACEKVFANAGTLTGSIGVIMHFMDLQKLFEWAKVKPNIIKAGQYKDIGSESRTMRDDERALLQELLDETHKQFKQAVKEGRNLPDEKVEKYCDGRIFSGESAKRLGFVDELGGEKAAIRAIAEAANLGDKPKILRKRRDFGSRFGLFSKSTLKQSESSIYENLLSGVLKKFLPGALQAELKSGVPYFLPESYFSGRP